MKFQKSRRTPGRILPLAGAALFALLTLAACGGTSSVDDVAPAASTPAYAPAEEYGHEMTAAEPAPAAGTGGLASARGAGTEGEASARDAGAAGGAEAPTLTQPQDGRQIILTANLSIETLEFAKTCDSLQKAAVECGGYVAGASVDGTAGVSLQNANYTFKVPADKYSDFLGRASETGNVTQRNEQSEDVTATLVDIESRLKALRTQEERLLTLMSEAGNLEDLITVQEKLSEVQYEIERYTGNKRALENLVAYSTVEVLVAEVRQVTPRPPVTYGSRAHTAFTNSWRSAGTFFQEVGLVLIWGLPLLLILAVVGGVVFFFVRRARKKRKDNPPPTWYSPPSGPAPAPVFAPLAPLSPKPKQDAKPAEAAAAPPPTEEKPAEAQQPPAEHSQLD